MREGYWINFKTGRVFEIAEHEQWIRDLKNARSLGLPSGLIAMFGNFRPTRDRDKFLLFIMQHAPVIRARGHGDYVSFEYASRERHDPLDAIWIWGKQNAGPFTMFHIVNFATKENVEMIFQEFEDAMDKGGAEAVLRVATFHKEVRKGIARELLKLSQEFLERT